MNFNLVEPLKFLFKDEVRKLGLELNLSKEIVFRHPFPGPGLAIRMPGIITKEKIEILKKADHYFIEALKKINSMIKFGKLMLPYFQLKLLE